MGLWHLMLLCGVIVLQAAAAAATDQTSSTFNDVDVNEDGVDLATNMSRAAAAVNRLESYLWDLEERLTCAARSLDSMTGAAQSPSLAPELNPQDCSDVYKHGTSVRGVYTVWPGGSNPIDVVCNFDANGAWTVIQRRLNGDTEFQRSWAACKNGFGKLAYYSNFWLGLETMYRLTIQRQYILRIDITDWDGERRYAQYSLFAIDDEGSNYRLSVYGYSGTAGDGLASHDGNSFSTIDRDNDRSFFEHCAITHQGPWWYDACDAANLNGRYRSDVPYTEAEVDVGIEWSVWKDRHPFKEVTMSIKPMFDDDL